MERGRGGREREGWGRPPAYYRPPPTGFYLKYHPDNADGLVGDIQSVK